MLALLLLSGIEDGLDDLGEAIAREGNEKQMIEQMRDLKQAIAKLENALAIERNTTLDLPALPPRRELN